jgi:hypothetical protein
VTSETELTGLASPELCHELQRLKTQIDKLVKAFPHLAHLSHTPSVVSLYKGLPPEQALLYDLTRRIRSLKVELVRRDEDVETASGETATPRHKKRGRTPGGRRGPLYKRVLAVCKERGTNVKPADLLELPQIKELAKDYQNPNNQIAKALCKARKDLSS